MGIGKEVDTLQVSKKLREVGNNFIFIGPAFLFFAVIVIVPFFLDIYYSLTSWNGVSGHVEWVGLANYIKIFTSDELFFRSFRFTFLFTITTVLLSNLIAFLFALGLIQALRTRNLLRVSFFLPHVLAGLLLGFIWRFILIDGFQSIGKSTGIGFFNLPWLGDARMAFWGIVLVFVWQISGYLMVIYIAFLQNIDASLLEAARIDGAGPLKLLYKIILPLVVPAFTVCLFLSLSAAFKVFDLNLSLTNGGPFESTQSVALHIYFEAFQTNRFGLGSAKAFIFFVVVAVITVCQVIVTKKREVQM